MGENARDVLAICCLAQDADADIEWARGIVAKYREAEHYGDCTKVPMTCFRCCVDEAFTNADRARAALDAAGLAVVPVVPTFEMIAAADDRANEMHIAVRDGASDWSGEEIAAAAWSAALAAAPKP